MATKRKGVKPVVEAVRRLCHYCRCRMTRRRDNLYPTKQHIVPKRRGGDNSKTNLRPCCRRCNTLLERVDDCPGALYAVLAVLGMNATPTAVFLMAKTWPRVPTLKELNA